jgi:uncharacterized protein YjiS (DUF1127 family)
MSESSISEDRPWPYRLHSPAAAGAGQRSWAGLSRLIMAVLREYRARRANRHLLALSDHTLKDIGLTRDEVARAVRLGRDPS